MRKKLTALACALALCISLAPAASAAQSGQGEVLQVLSVMGVMNGDANGNLNLSSNVTRAEFTKMAVAASVYKDTATATSYVSPFSDVKYTHWAAGYVKTGVDAGWINGYLDGTFRPNNSVKWEEAVTICLKMLGYTDEDFSTGTYPYPQLALAQNLKLATGIGAKQGEALTRQECAQLIYNTLNATAKGGQPYASTLGYSVDAAGNIDYLSVVNAELEGPIIVGSGSWTADLGFTPAAVYRNDSESTASAVAENDVLYYLEKTKTVWAYHNQVTGIYESASPSRSNPTSVVVSGVSYSFETSAAAYSMSTTGSYQPGDAVTLLLGRDNTIAAVSDPSQISDTTYGIVLGTGTTTYTDAQGKPYTAPYVKILGMDGMTYQYQAEQSGYYKEGDLIRVSFEDGKVKLSRISSSSKGLSGTVNSAATKLGSYTFADDVRIMDYADEAAVTIRPSRLAGVRIDSGDVAYYELNGAEEIETLILKNVTGDMYSFGILTDDEGIPGVGLDGTVEITGHMYTIQSNGTAVGPLVCDGITFPVSAGDAVRYRLDGSELSKMYSLTDVRLNSVSSSEAVASNNQKFNLENGVQVYERRYQSGLGTQYYLTSIDQVSGGDYTLTGWYDKAESEGGRMRVIVAVAK